MIFTLVPILGQALRSDFMDEKLKNAMKKAIEEGRLMVEKSKTGMEIQYFEDEETGIWYPMFKLSEEMEINKDEIPYGVMWKEYLIENKNHEIVSLIMTGELGKRMIEIQQIAENYKQKIIDELLQKQPMPDSSKTLERASHLNNIYQIAEEMTIKDIVESIV